MVSEKHCNFLINTGDATAADIEALGEEVRRRVRDRSGVELDLGNQAHRPPGGESADQERRASMKRVSVLMGGPSAEREVSLNSGANCAAALKEAGYKVSTIDVDPRPAEPCSRRSRRRSPMSCSTRCTAAGSRTATSRAS